MPFNTPYYTWTDEQTSEATDPFTLHWSTADAQYSVSTPYVAELVTCRDQITVQDFAATAQPGFAVTFPGDQVLLEVAHRSQR
jgi:hypothetical protein